MKIIRSAVSASDLSVTISQLQSDFNVDHWKGKKDYYYNSVFNIQTFSHIPTDRALLPHKFLPPALNIWPTRQPVPEQDFLQLLRLGGRRLVQELLHHAVTSNILLGEQSAVQSQSEK